MFQLYQEIFTHKIRYNSKICMLTDEKNIIFNEDIIKSLKLTIINLKSIDEIDNINNLFDFIILENIFDNLTTYEI